MAEASQCVLAKSILIQQRRRNPSCHSAGAKRPARTGACCTSHFNPDTISRTNKVQMLESLR
ncbi:unnamed protein product [Pleuronectes platessa]|uniref:Uncharacterized protein n=1 Tax=Pleuronectes platessa TaxID=8262 RepID=A0A9N7VUP7_PLEPL|nr:unnamed protein product [Pleuronectes platessa]